VSQVLGFDIGGTNIRGALLDADGNVIATNRRSRPFSPEDMLDAVTELAAELEAKSDGKLGGVGLGCAGCVDSDGVVLTSPNIPSLVHFPLKRELEDRFGLPIVAENDATTATWAEAITGAGEGYKDVVFVAFGTGIGGGFVIDGELRRGAHGLAGEIGHMIIDPSGPACVCGRHGCWEQMASGGALGRLARDAAAKGRAPTIVTEAGGNVDDIQGEHVATLLAKGDPVARALLVDLAHQIAIGLNNLVNVLDPEVIVIGGGLSDIGDPFFDAVRRGFDEVMVDRLRRPELPILGASHGGLAGALGAGLLVRDQIA